MNKIFIPSVSSVDNIRFNITFLFWKRLFSFLICARRILRLSMRGMVYKKTYDGSLNFAPIQIWTVNCRSIFRDYLYLLDHPRTSIAKFRVKPRLHGQFLCDKIYLFASVHPVYTRNSYLKTKDWRHRSADDIKKTANFMCCLVYTGNFMYVTIFICHIKTNNFVHLHEQKKIVT